MMVENSFSDRLAVAVRERATPLIVGLDPRSDQLPEALRGGTGSDRPEEVANSYSRFCCEIIDVVAPMVPAVKPQAAFFEQLGPHGMAALAEVILYARQKGLLVIFDGKRNDIGSTAAAYAQGILGGSADGGWDADALTVNPYLGGDSLDPFVEACRQLGAGIFVLVKTSNPGGGLFQDLVSDGRPLYRHVADYVSTEAAQTRGKSGYSPVGAVVGATYPDQLAELRGALPHSWLLVPGFGSQGGTAGDVANAFDQDGLGAVINSSRAIIFAYDRKEYRQRYASSEWQRSVQDAARDAIDELRAEGIGKQLS
jgi:orotidine-5'-phosphate decarboxylase